jgi:hypothetical protein
MNLMKAGVLMTLLIHGQSKDFCVIMILSEELLGKKWSFPKSTEKGVLRGV